MNSTNYNPCDLDEPRLNSEIILTILLIISEILPFIKHVKSNGIIQAIKLFMFHKDKASTEESEPIYRST
jgi:hypothetical protein